MPTGAEPGLTIASPELRALLSDDQGHIVIGQIGDRPFYVLADPDLLSNRGMRDVGQERAALELLDWLNSTGATSVAFDVTRNGFGHSPSPLKLVFEPPFLAMTLALAAAVLLAGIQATARFGAPRRRERATAEGLIYRRERSGWYVSASAITYDPTGCVGFMTYVAEQGRTPSTETLYKKSAPAPSGVADIFGAPPGTTLYTIRRRRMIDGRPVLVERTIVDPAIAPDLLSHSLDGSLTHILTTTYGVTVARNRVAMRPCALVKEEADALGVKSGTPGLLVACTSQLYDQRDRASRVAFKQARGHGNRVTSAEKSNVTESGVSWREVVTALHAREFPDVSLDHMLADNAAMQIVRAPTQFDVLLTDKSVRRHPVRRASHATGSLRMLPAGRSAKRASSACTSRSALPHPISRTGAWQIRWRRSCRRNGVALVVRAGRDGGSALLGRDMRARRRGPDARHRRDVDDRADGWCGAGGA